MLRDRIGAPISASEGIVVVQALSNAGRIELIVVRNGQPVTHTYDVVDAAP